VVIHYGYPLFYSYPISDYSASYSIGTRTVRNGSAASYTTETGSRYEKSYEDEYWKLGRDWGQDLRRDVVTFEHFVAFVGKKIVTAPESLRRQFRDGFIAGYGQHGAEAFEKAFDAAHSQRDGAGRQDD
jgi:hypothetical protein